MNCTLWFMIVEKLIHKYTRSFYVLVRKPNTLYVFLLHQDKKTENEINSHYIKMIICSSREVYICDCNKCYKNTIYALRHTRTYVPILLEKIINSLTIQVAKIYI